MTECVCPITLLPIEQIGITCSGNIYEYEAIKHWLQYHDTDPLSNLYLPTKFVLKFEGSLEEAKIKAADYNKTTKIWSPGFATFSEAPEIYRNLTVQQGYTGINWPLFNRAAVDSFINNYESRYVNEELDIAIQRPAKTGTRYQFVDFSQIREPIVGKDFKSELFDFSNLTGLKFINCDFSRCRFIGTNLQNTIFKLCIFKGEQICFYNATGKPTFINCQFEYSTKWVMTYDSEEIEKILHERRLKEFNVEFRYNSLLEQLNNLMIH